MSDLTKNQIDILKHTVGFDSGTPFYRNHFVAGEGHYDMPDIKILVEADMMIERKAPSWMNDDPVFLVTEKGKELLLELKGKDN